ncbi:Glu-tRNA(Gln) amidotransferase subunit GatD [Candidatus Pacearchaeota archaeon]|nr:Glu-tRNA(Gln) amidotransferase subunit GatD [Candidatus Pacearchaeota archaeon]
MKPNPGDKVEIHLAKQTYKGVLLESSESGIVMLKLESGYNIGLNRKDILEIEVIGKASEEKEDVEIKKDADKPNIAMIITGGTIAARLNPRKGGVDWLDTPESLLKFYPGVFDKVNVVKVEVPFMKASEDMDFKDWQKLAKVAEKLLNDSSIQGIIITHGTDFLHYTSAALSFFLRDLNKPVILTYSQRSIDRASSDANLNLQCAALAAISDMAEVMIVGHANTNDDFCYAMPGTKVRKMHTSRRDAFKVVNAKPFAKIDSENVIKLSDYRLRNKSNVKVDSKFEEEVALIKVYPGQDPHILDYYLKNKYKGIVLEMGGLGHVPTQRARHSWIKKLKEVQKKSLAASEDSKESSEGMIVCAVSQTIYGRLDPLVYSNGREIMGTGVIYLEDMLAETALVKLGWVLGHKEWSSTKDKVKEKMLKNFSHEVNDRLEE